MPLAYINFVSGGHPDQGLPPGSPGMPDQGLPGSQPGIDNSLPTPPPGVLPPPTGAIPIVPAPPGTVPPGTIWPPGQSAASEPRHLPGKPRASLTGPTRRARRIRQGQPVPPPHRQDSPCQPHADQQAAGTALAADRNAARIDQAAGIQGGLDRWPLPVARLDDIVP